MQQLVARLLNLQDVGSIERMEPSFAAPWARDSAAWVFLGCVLLAAVAGFFYYRNHSHSRPKTSALLAIGRAIVLCVMFTTLADPILVVKYAQLPRPWLWFLFDGTDSMGIEDEYPEEVRQRMDAAAGVLATAKPASIDAPRLSRADYVRAWLKNSEKNPVREFSAKYRLRAYQFDRPDGVRELPGNHGDETAPDPADWAGQLSTDGQVTALGKAFADLSLRQSAGQLGGVVVVSDFDQNAGPPALEAARMLGAPVYTVGVGAEAAVDLALDLQAPLLMKKAERATIVATLRHSGLGQRPVSVRVSARRISGPSTDAPAAGPGAVSIAIGEKSVPLESSDQAIEFPWVPAETGRFVLSAEADPQPGEIVTKNNQTVREIDIRDDFLRLMFVEYEPTWEWRFMKEVFHRDKLVGMRGFRTFLRSADPNVRRTNELFLSTLTPRRNEFFANDVIFVGDMPASTLSTRFCEMAREFVDKFGGGLVIVSGPRFGPNQLANTPLADMLPVVVEPGSRLRDEKSFVLQLTPEAAHFDFMQLGSDERENAKAWSNLGPLPWYQPVARLHPQATALAVHPTDTCVDGRTLQPVIAVRHFGRGQVIYLGINETWRLRRRFGELYYRQFWGQMIHRLGLSHALGSQKRFVVRTDRQQYQPDERVLLSVEAYDANYEPLTENDLPQRTLSAELILPGSETERGNSQILSIPQFREGVFELRIPVSNSGEHRVSVKDPVTGETSDVYFQVTNISVERRSAVRNVALEREIAQATGGKNYDLTTFADFAKDFRPAAKPETIVRVIQLWNTWLTFVLVLTLLFGEWLIRKFVNLS